LGVDRESTTGKLLTAAEASLASVAGNLVFSALGSAARPAAVTTQTAQDITEVAQRVLRTNPEIEMDTMIRQVAEEVGISPKVVAAKNVKELEESFVNFQNARQEAQRATEAALRTDMDDFATQGIRTAGEVAVEESPIERYIRFSQESAQEPSVLARQIDDEILQRSARQADLEEAFAEMDVNINQGGERVVQAMRALPEDAPIKQMPETLELLNEFYAREEFFNKSRLLNEALSDNPGPYWIEPGPIEPLQINGPILFRDQPAAAVREAVEPTILGPTGRPATGALADIQLPRALKTPSEEPLPRVRKTGLTEFDVRLEGGEGKVVRARTPESAIRQVTRSQGKIATARVVNLEDGIPYTRDPNTGNLVRDPLGFREGLSPTVRSLEESGLSAWADKTIRESMGRFNANGFLDPTLWSAYAIKGAQLIGRGVVKLKDWTEQMVKQYGVTIKPFLNDIYESAKKAVRPIVEPVVDATGRTASTVRNVYNLTVGDFRQPIWTFLERNILDVAKAGKGELQKQYRYLTTFIGAQEPKALMATNYYKTFTRQIILNSMDEAAKRMQLPMEDFRKVFSRYVEARHGPDLNAIYGDGKAGFTNDQYKTFMRTLSPEDIETMEPIRAQMRMLYDEAFELQSKSGLPTPAMRDAMRRDYPNYVSFQRAMDDLTDEEWMYMLANPGSEIPSRGSFKRFKGSQREVRDALDNLDDYYLNAIRRTAQNNQIRAVAEFFEQHKEFLRNRPHKKIITMGAGAKKGAVERTATRLEDLSPEVLQGLDDDAATMFRIRKRELERSAESGTGDKIPRYETLKKNEIPFIQDGKHMVLEVKDWELAAAITGSWANSKFWSWKPFKTLRMATATMSYNLTTGRAIDFVPTMGLRDPVEAWLNLQRIADVGAIESARMIATELPASFKTMIKGMAYRNDIHKGLKTRLMKQFGVKIPDAGDPDVQQHLGFFKGVKTGGRGQYIIRNLEETMDALRLGKMNDYRKYLTGFMENAVELTEDSIRYSVYRNLIKKGFTPEEAARGTWESSFNPYSRGVATRALQMGDMFVTTSFQSAKSHVATMTYKGGKIAFKALAGVLTLEAIAWQWNEMVYPRWHDKINKGKANNALVFITGIKENGDPDLFHIPYTYPLHFFKRISNLANRMARPATYERQSAAQEIGYLAGGVISGLTPYSEGDVLNDVMTPSLYQPVRQLENNRDWLRNQIYRKDMGGTNFNTYWPEFSESVTGKILIAATAEAYDQTNNAAFQSIVGGPVDLSPEAVNFAFRQYLGGFYDTPASVLNLIGKITDNINGKPGTDIRPQDIPGIRVFFTTVDNNRAESFLNISKAMERELTEYESEKTDRRARMEQVSSQVAKMIQEDRQAEVADYVRAQAEKGAFAGPKSPTGVDPDQYANFQQMLQRRLQRDQMDREMQWLNRFGVKDGSRARKIVERISGMSPEERQRYMESITAGPRPVATEEVLEQMSGLIPAREE
jgi:hypothetical protein